MTAPNLRVLAVGHYAVGHYAVAKLLATDAATELGGTLMLCEMHTPEALATAVGSEHDLCRPGAQAEVAAQLALAGSKLAGGPGVAWLANQVMIQRRRANRLAGDMRLIGQTISDMRRECASESCPNTIGLDQIDAIVESGRPDMENADPVESARSVLATAGWSEAAPGFWTHKDGLGCISILTPGAGWKSAELRAFATLIDEVTP